MTEIQVFKAVVQGMASKIRYLQVSTFQTKVSDCFYQDYKLDREQMQIALFKQRHFNEKLKKDNLELIQENKTLAKKVDLMKQIMLEFDHERADEVTQENVRTILFFVKKDLQYFVEKLESENNQLRELLLIH